MATTRPVRFGLTLPQIKRSWPEARAAAETFDALGFDSLWVCDHLYGVPMPQLPILEAWTELAAVGAVTSRAALGTLVTPPFFRNAAVLAKQVATLDAIAPGRVIVGLGSGWFASEFEAYGAPFPPVGDRLLALEETCAVMKRMWTEPSVTFDGRFVQVRDALCEPKPAERPRILVGGGGEKKLLRIAARHADVWNNPAVHQAELARKLDVLRRHCDDVGRDAAEIEVSQQCLVVIAADDAAAKEAVGKAARIYGGHMGGALEAHGIWGTPQQVIDKIGRHVELGCTHFVMELFGRDTREPARLFAETVMPAFRA